MAVRSNTCQVRQVSSRQSADEAGYCGADTPTDDGNYSLTTYRLPHSKAKWDLGYFTISRRRDGTEIGCLLSKASTSRPSSHEAGWGGTDTPADDGNYSPPATQQGGMGSKLSHDLTPPRWR